MNTIKASYLFVLLCILSTKMYSGEMMQATNRNDGLYLFLITYLSVWIKGISEIKLAEHALDKENERSTVKKLLESNLIASGTAQDTVTKHLPLKMSTTIAPQNEPKISLHLYTYSYKKPRPFVAQQSRRNKWHQFDHARRCHRRENFNHSRHHSGRE